MRCTVTDRWVIPIFVPPGDAGGAVPLVIAGSVEVEQVRRLLAAGDLNETNFAALADARNVVVARPDALHGQVVGRPIPFENACRILGRRAGLYRTTAADGTERVIGFHAVPAGR